MTYFVYELWNPLTQKIFYVGMGKRPDRPLDHVKETRSRMEGRKSGSYNKMKIGIIKEILIAGLLPDVKIVFRSESLADTYKEEIRLISTYGRRDLNQGPLANMNDGGSGGSRRLISNEERIKMSQRKLGRSFEDQFGFDRAQSIKKAIREARIAQGATGRSWSRGLTKDSHPSLKKISESLKGTKPWNLGLVGFGLGEANNFYGRSHSDESKKKMSDWKKEHYRGSGNPKAKSFKFTDPTGVIYIVTGGFSNFCKEHLLPMSSMRKAIGQGPIASGKAKNWVVEEI